MHRHRPYYAVVLALVALAPALAGANTAWLDRTTPANWNVAGAALPKAPTVDRSMDARCLQGGVVRPASMPEDRALQNAGWRLLGPYERFGATALVQGQIGFDGMCRPLRYQGFIFVSGRFAGTLAPRPMESRVDGSMQTPTIYSAGELSATFDRYAATDALCCPSRLTSVDYAITATPKGPLLSPTSASTEATGAK